MTHLFLICLLLAGCAVNPEATKPLPPPHGNAVATNAPENAR